MSEDCGDQGCQLGDLFRLLGANHMMGVLHTLVSARGPLRFNEIQERNQISPNTLSARLKALEGAGMVTRTAYPEIPPRVEYEATDKARRLRKVFRALGEWSKENDLRPAPLVQIKA